MHFQNNHAFYELRHHLVEEHYVFGSPARSSSIFSATIRLTLDFIVDHAFVIGFSMIEHGPIPENLPTRFDSRMTRDTALSITIITAFSGRISEFVIATKLRSEDT